MAATMQVLKGDAISTLDRDMPKFQERKSTEADMVRTVAEQIKKHHRGNVAEGYVEAAQYAVDKFREAGGLDWLPEE